MVLPTRGTPALATVSRAVDKLLAGTDTLNNDCDVVRGATASFSTAGDNLVNDVVNPLAAAEVEDATAEVEDATAEVEDATAEVEDATAEVEDATAEDAAAGGMNP
jgi:uncharacterized protein YoxC